MRAGDHVRLIGIPSDVRDDEELPTQTLFEKCLGKIFTVEDVESVAGLHQQLAKLEVGHVLGKPSYTHAIWVEENSFKLKRSPAKIEN